MEKILVAVLISGNGSNLQALIDDISQDALHPARLALVISNKPDAYGIQRAIKAGIAVRIISHKDYAMRDAYDAVLQKTLEEFGIEFVCLAGFMRLLSAGFAIAWAGRMLNIHPSLLPAYKGLDTHARVLADGASVTGCTVHYVVPEMDAGAVLLQEIVPVLIDDTPQSLADRVHSAEHRVYPRALRMALL